MTSGYGTRSKRAKLNTEDKSNTEAKSNTDGGNPEPAMDAETHFMAKILEHLIQLGPEKRTDEYNKVNHVITGEPNIHARTLYNHVFMMFFKEDAHNGIPVLDRDGFPLSGGKTIRNRRRHCRHSLKHKHRNKNRHRPLSSKLRKNNK